MFEIFTLLGCYVVEIRSCLLTFWNKHMFEQFGLLDL
jgi:hypothetical protein